MESQRLAALREAAYLCRVVEILDMLSGAGDGDAVQQFEKVEVQSLQDSLGGALFRRKPGPCVERSLGTTKDFLNTYLCPKFLAKCLGFALVGQGELIAQVSETIVNRGR